LLITRRSLEATELKCPDASPVARPESSVASGVERRLTGSRTVVAAGEYDDAENGCDN
jgi:hypothetical protein